MKDSGTARVSEGRGKTKIIENGIAFNINTFMYL